jgi:ankyrin repeat protein
MLPREIIDHICLYLPLEKAWNFSPYATKKIYNPEIHDSHYWLKVTDNKDISIIKYFLENNKIQQIDKDELCGWACCRGRTDVLQLLLDSGMDYENINFSIYWACCNDQFETVKFLINLGCKVKSRNNRRHIFPSIVNRGNKGNYIIIKWLLENKHYDIKKEKDEDSLSCVNNCDNEYLNIVKLLLEHGCDLNFGDNRYTLSIACEEGDFELVKLLLEYGADPTFRDNDAIKSAKNNNRLKIVKLLSDHGYT